MKLQAHKRDTQISLEEIRSNGSTPCVCYGPDVESTAIQVNHGELISLVHNAGSSTIIDLDIDGEEHEVLLKDIHRHPVTEDILHVDLYAIKRGAEMEINVPIELVGESQAVKEGGVFTQVMYELPVRCRPRALPEQIEVDISLLEAIGDSITVSDLNLGEGIELLSDPEETIATASEVVEEPEEDEDSEEAMADVLADKSEEDSEESEES